MARLADLLWTWKPVCPDPLRCVMTQELQQDLMTRFGGVRQRIATCPVIVADNVCEYFFAGTTQDYFEYQTDFPCSAPPFDRFFVEMKRPSNILAAPSHRRGDARANDLPHLWGHYCEGVPATELTDSHFGTLIAPAIEANASINLETARRECKWILSMLLISADNGELITPWVNTFFFVDLHGGVLTVPVHAFGGTGGSPGFAQYSSSAGVLAMPTLLTLSFMNCENVRIEDNTPRELKPREVKAGQRPWVKYKTLDIDPMKKVLRTEGQSEEIGLKRALHICRGHFANYTEEKPLFGRLSGRFWIPSHVRGSVSQGVVAKQYNVKPGVPQ